MKKQLMMIVAFCALQASQSFAAWPLELPWMNAHGSEKTYRASDHPDAVFVVEAYFDGCGWCHKNSPLVNALAKEFQGNDRVQFLDVGVDYTDREFQSWINATKPNHPVLKDPDGASFLSDFNIQGYPTTLVLDSNGDEQYRHIGYWGANGASEVRDAINEALVK
jgi:hypothetical protein